MTQFELAQAAGIHSRSVGKIERGLTTKLNQRTLRGLVMALGVPQEFLETVTKGQEVQLPQSMKFCPQCWNPGHTADPIWQNVQARFCYLCGTQLRASCANCGELLVSTRHRFCPICGHPYKKSVPTAKT
ncbi:MAG: double zinc ribbon domain-containing protein [Nostoc sp. CmiSLP01]|nr:zinc ribbon domain-containing protein [Nostoc sp. CmiSLP01]MDZ8282002.1 zinc ribbon domain-containing protein [Nostoc sp. ChiSLP01]